MLNYSVNRVLAKCVCVCVCVYFPPLDKTTIICKRTTAISL